MIKIELIDKRLFLFPLIIEKFYFDPTNREDFQKEFYSRDEKIFRSGIFHFIENNYQMKIENQNQIFNKIKLNNLIKKENSQLFQLNSKSNFQKISLKRKEFSFESVRLKFVSFFQIILKRKDFH